MSFPKYLMKVERKSVFLSFSDAKQVLSDDRNASCGEYVLNEDWTMSLMTQQDRDELTSADKW